MANCLKEVKMLCGEIYRAESKIKLATKSSPKHMIQ